MSLPLSLSVPGVVTAEMCQSRDDTDVMSKMVEELDEVRRVCVCHTLLRWFLHWDLNCVCVCVCVFQVSSLQYKKFLAFPWILTVTWPMDSVSIFLNQLSKTDKNNMNPGCVNSFVVSSPSCG